MANVPAKDKPPAIADPMNGIKRTTSSAAASALASDAKNETIPAILAKLR